MVTFASSRGYCWHSHSHAHTHTHALTHTRTLTQTPTHTHTHKHACTPEKKPFETKTPISIVVTPMWRHHYLEWCAPDYPRSFPESKRSRSKEGFRCLSRSIKQDGGLGGFFAEDYFYSSCHLTTTRQLRAGKFWPTTCFWVFDRMPFTFSKQTLFYFL